MRTQPSPLTRANLADVQSQEANPFLAANINDSKLLLSGEEPVGREIKGQSGDRTRDYPIHVGRSATELPSRLLEES